MRVEDGFLTRCGSERWVRTRCGNVRSGYSSIISRRRPCIPWATRNMSACTSASRCIFCTKRRVTMISRCFIVIPRGSPSPTVPLSTYGYAPWSVLELDMHLSCVNSFTKTLDARSVASFKPNPSVISPAIFGGRPRPASAPYSSPSLPTISPPRCGSRDIRRPLPTHGCSP